MRSALVALLCVTALVAVSSGTSAPSAVETRSCSQVGPFFNIVFAGNIDGTRLPFYVPAVFDAIPSRKAMVAVWSYGTQENLTPTVYSWAAGSDSRMSARCPARSLTAPRRGSLRARLHTKDGWALGREYRCEQRGRVAIAIRELESLTRVTVWMEKSRELIAVAEIRRGSATLRASTRCAERG